MSCDSFLDLTPGDLGLHIRFGDGFSRPFSITFGGSPLDITGLNFFAKLKPFDSAVIDLTVTVNDAATGLLTLSAVASVLAPATAGGEHWWDLVETTNEQTYLAGRFVVEADKVDN